MEQTTRGTCPICGVESPLGRVRQQARFGDGMHPRFVHADSHMWYPERKAEGTAHSGLLESNINAILPDGRGFSDCAGDCYMRGLICRVPPCPAEDMRETGPAELALAQG